MVICFLFLIKKLMFDIVLNFFYTFICNDVWKVELGMVFWVLGYLYINVVVLEIVKHKIIQLGN